jgi:SOS-response transcriptional repressor LexA
LGRGCAERCDGQTRLRRAAAWRLDGDIAVLLPGIAATNGETVVANLRNQGLLCKIMHVQLDKNLVKLSSYNPAYPPTEYHRDEFHWIFPVATIVKQLRRK